MPRLSKDEFPDRIKAHAFALCGARCANCQAVLRGRDARYDHIKPVEFGGEPTLENCQVLCVSCHAEKTGKHDIPDIRRAARQSLRKAGFRVKGAKGGKRYRAPANGVPALQRSFEIEDLSSRTDEEPPEL